MFSGNEGRSMCFAGSPGIPKGERNIMSTVTAINTQLPLGGMNASVHFELDCNCLRHSPFIKPFKMEIYPLLPSLEMIPHNYTGVKSDLKSGRFGKKSFGRTYHLSDISLRSDLKSGRFGEEVFVAGRSSIRMIAPVCAPFEEKTQRSPPH
ncbi:hypothetical protein CEXT_179681 [Caerostris extrusa]|uniref:Uncharacterized protein n=1 Tax=Caerostris extrusa TaxID=172846 RepID=A0AAV4WB10_CAEEX|nr:hypothetical protein CEXT_179681 [Caerostris extrusa]